MLDLTTAYERHRLTLTFATALISITGTYRLISLLNKDKKSYKQIPSPGSWVPFFGHFFSIGKNPRATVTRWNKELGPLIMLQMGGQNWLMISSPSLAHEIFATNGQVSSDRQLDLFTNYSSYGGLGVAFSNPTKQWQKARKAILQVLAPPRVSEISAIIEHEVDCLVQQLLSRTALYGQFDPMTTLNVAAMNKILTTVFGQRVESADDPLLKDIMYFVNFTVNNLGVEGPISQYLPVFGLLDSILGKKRYFENFVTNVRDPLFRRLIQEGLQSDKDCLIKSFVKYDFLEQELIVLMGNIDDMLSAGTDPVSNSLAWQIVLLSHRPDIQANLRAEVDVFISSHNRLPTFEDRHHFPYLTSVQRESLRFRTSPPFGLPHKAKEDIIVRDYLIPKGTILMPNMQGIHMDPDIYPDPEVFKPERFLEDTRTMMASANGKVDNRDQFSFGFGRRICPGIHMAEVEMFTAWTRIFAHCVIAPPLDANGKEVPIDTRPSPTVALRLSPRPFVARFLPRSDSLLESPLKSSSATL